MPGTTKNWPEKGRSRGKQRDALTLLDESGVIVSGTNPAVLQALSKKDWKTAFLTHRSEWEAAFGLRYAGTRFSKSFLLPINLSRHMHVLLQTPVRCPIIELDDLAGFWLLAR